MPHTFRWRWRALAGVAALCAGCMQGPQGGLWAHADASAAELGEAAPCSAGAGSAGWRAAQQDLRAQGLALRPACPGGAQEPRLVVLDALRASEVLRGPLADGEAVDLGGVAGAGDVSPDVAFNRDWVQTVLLRHQVRAHAVGESRSAPF